MESPPPAPESSRLMPVSLTEDSSFLAVREGERVWYQILTIWQQVTEEHRAFSKHETIK